MHPSFSQTSFMSGSLSVLRIGDGITALSGSAAPVYIDEYKTDGTLIRSIALPSTSGALTGSNKMLTLSGNEVTEGSLSLSVDGKQLTFAGYDAVAGYANVSASTTTATKRIVGVINGAGNVNTTTTLNINNAGVIRSAIADGTNLWVAGIANAVYHTTIGSTTATKISSMVGRVLRIFNGQLYVSQNLSNIVSVSKLGNGLPLSTDDPVLVTPEALPGLPKTGSANEFFLADVNDAIPGPDVIYFANTATGHAISKYSKKADGNWISNGVISDGGQYTSVAGVVSLDSDGGKLVTLYGIMFQSTSTSLVKIVDSAPYNGDFSSLSRTDIISTVDIKTRLGQAESTVFRSVSLSPQTATLPVSLIYFKGEAIQNSVKLNWSTASENNNSHFEIYRSTDGQLFTKIGAINGNNTVTEEKKYTFTDSLPLSSMSYYKLRQVDFDGHFSEYNPLAISTTIQNPKLSIIVKENLIQVLVYANKATNGEFEIIDILGNKLASKITNLTNGWNTVNIPLNIPSGMYVLTVRNGKEISRKKFLS